MIRSHADVSDAYAAGRTHSQRFIKTGAGQANDTCWQDWAFQAGQPAYDARIGPVGAFTPAVAVNNDALWFPGIAPGLERKLHKITITPKASNASQASIDFVLYDLVGYYPLIDGDSTDTQEFDNTQALPRYADGDGLQMVIVNHVSPAVQNGRTLLEYTDASGTDRTLDVGVVNNGINTACAGQIGTTTTVTGALCLPLGGGETGVRRVNRLTYTVPPGGLHCIYLIKPLAQFKHYHDALLQADATGSKHALEVDFALKDGWRMPTVLDGAHLSFFYRPNGGGRTCTFLGMADFLWG